MQLCQTRPFKSRTRQPKTTHPSWISIYNMSTPRSLNPASQLNVTTEYESNEWQNPDLPGPPSPQYSPQRTRKSLTDPWIWKTSNLYLNQGRPRPVLYPLLLQLHGVLCSTLALWITRRCRCQRRRQRWSRSRSRSRSPRRRRRRAVAVAVAVAVARWWWHGGGGGGGGGGCGGGGGGDGGGGDGGGGGGGRRGGRCGAVVAVVVGAAAGGGRPWLWRQWVAVPWQCRQLRRQCKWWWRGAGGVEAVAGWWRRQRRCWAGQVVAAVPTYTESACCNCWICNCACSGFTLDDVFR